MIVPTEDEEHYRYLLDSFDTTAQQVADLPAFINPDLLPNPATLPRKFWKEQNNPLNAWSHRTNIISTSPTSKTLSGCTVAIKDNISISAIPITDGSFPELLVGKSEFPTSEIDAVVVSRILSAGGHITGSATCEHFSMTPLSFTSASGPVHNPWKKGWTAGGSSSGPAALVGVSQIREWRKRQGLASADDLLGPGVDMAIGGDQGGSIRIPAAYCGIYGLKPTHGLVPYTGILSLCPLIDHVGPMAKSVEDIAKLLGVIAGYDGFDPRMTPESPRRNEVNDYHSILSSWIQEKKENLEWTSESAGRGLKIGVIKESFQVLGLSDEVKRIVSAAIERFKAIGAIVEEVSIPMHLIGPSIWTVATRIPIATQGFQNHPLPMLSHPLPGISPPPFSQKAYEIFTKYNPAVVNVIFSSTFLMQNREPDLQAKAMMHVYQLRAAYDEALAKYDVLVTPLNSKLGSKHPTYEMDVLEKMTPSIGATLNTCQFNCTGRKFSMRELISNEKC